MQWLRIFPTTKYPKFKPFTKLMCLMHMRYDMTHLHLEAAGARPHRDLVHLPLAAAGPALVAPAAAPAAPAPLARPVLPAFVVAATAAALVLAAGVVLLAP